MKKYAVVLSVLVVALLATQAFADYDKDFVVQTMRSNGAAMGAINKAVKAGDLFAVAVELVKIAKNEKTLQGMDVPKGSQEEWSRIHGAIVTAAVNGIVAYIEEDTEKLNGYIAEIGALIKEGHKAFR